MRQNTRLDRAVGTPEEPVSPARPAARESHEISWDFYMKLADGLVHLDRGGEAMEYLARAVAEASALGRRDPRLAGSLNALGVLHSRAGNHGKAQRLFRRAIAIYAKSYGPEHPETIGARYNLASACKLRQDYAGAAAECERALAEAERTSGPNHLDIARLLDLLGEVYMALGRRPAALFALRRALAIKETTGASGWELAVTLGKLGEFYLSAGQYGECEPLLARALSIKQQILGRNDPSLASDVKRLAEVYAVQGRPRTAEPLLETSAAMLERALGGKHPDIVPSLSRLAKLYREQARFSEVPRLLDIALAILNSIRGPKRPDTDVTLEFYSEMLRVLNLEASR
jgi:tetratricopeptide (TPR) repeat protein